MERIAPPSLNYDNVLPLAIESRSNRRTFLPVNGQSFSNASGSTIIRIDVNADSMLDPTHSYLSVDLQNDTTGAANTLRHLHPEIGPAFIQRLRIESGGVTIEDINEYGRLYTAMMLHQCPEDYVRNVCGSYNLYPELNSAIQTTGVGVADIAVPQDGASQYSVAGGGIAEHNNQNPAKTELTYCQDLNAAGLGTNVISGANIALPANAAAGLASFELDAGAFANLKKQGPILENESKTITIPLLSGFLNQDKYIPLIMMNAGFTIEIHLAGDNSVGICKQLEMANGVGGNGAAQAAAAAVDCKWSLKNVKYVANLIDLDREFYGRLRTVMEESGGVLQLAGQTYRHYSATVPAGAGEQTISLPARVKSIKSIFGTFVASADRNNAATYNTSVYHNGNIKSFRFEIGSVRYPQTDIKTSNAAGNRSELVSELHKAFGKLGDYSHSSSVRPKHYNLADIARNQTSAGSVLSAFMVGYDFEAFQKVALESGINTADRSLPLNFIYDKDANARALHADFYVLSDAIYYINLDGTVSVSV